MVPICSKLAVFMQSACELQVFYFFVYNSSWYPFLKTCITTAFLRNLWQQACQCGTNANQCHWKSSRQIGNGLWCWVSWWFTIPGTYRFFKVIVSSWNHTCFFQSLKFMNISTCFPAPRLSQNQNINWRSLPIPTSVAFIGCLNTFNWKCLRSCSQIFPVLLYLRNVLNFIVVFR